MANCLEAAPWTAATCVVAQMSHCAWSASEMGQFKCKVLRGLLHVLLQWTKGQPRPSFNTYSISHPGLSTSVPQIIAGAAPARSSQNFSSGSRAPPGMHTGNVTAGVQPSNLPSVGANSAAVPARPVASTEPNPDMEVPQGSERNLKGDKPQRWCEERGVAAQGVMSTNRTAQNGGSDAAWWSFKLPPVTVLVSNAWQGSSLQAVTVPPRQMC